MYESQLDFTTLALLVLMLLSNLFVWLEGGIFLYKRVGFQIYIEN